MAKNDKENPKVKKEVTKKKVAKKKAAKKKAAAKKAPAKKKTAAKKTSAKKVVKKTAKKTVRKKVPVKKTASEESDAAERKIASERDADQKEGDQIELDLDTPEKKEKPKKSKAKAKGEKKLSKKSASKKEKNDSKEDPQPDSDATPEHDSEGRKDGAGSKKKGKKSRDAKSRKSDSDGSDVALEEETSDKGDGASKKNRGRKNRKSDSDEEGKKEGDSGSPEGASEKKTEPKPKPKPEPEPEPDPGPPPPERVDLAEFQNKSVAELYELGNELGLRVGGLSSKHDLIFEIFTHWGRKGTKIDAEGVLEITNDGYGFLRWPDFNFAPNADDVYIGPNFVREHGIQTGNLVKVVARAPREREKFISVDEVTHIESIEVDKWERRLHFDKLTALSPRERLVLEDPERGSVSPRAIDIIAPLGKGQRGVIVAPPRGGKTILLKEIAGAISRNHPETDVIVLLLDERPEEVTDFEESGVASVYSSTFDEPPERHVQVAGLVAERAKRLVEIGRDVVILMDSLTRLARGYNGLTKGKGKTMSGGIDAGALQKSRRLFNIARNTEEAGSLTLVATALIDTGARMDDVIFEEFKGSGNMEVELDRDLLERRIFPAINIQKSGTRKDDLLYHPDEFSRIGLIRRQLAQLPGGEAMEKLIHNIENTKSNAELLLAGLK